MALESQQRTARAQEQGFFDLETIPVEIGGRKPVTITKDEYPRNDMTKESLQKLRPCFIQDGSGTVTPGNASGINDGAAAVVVASKSAATAKGLRPLAKIVSYAMSGCDPAVMGIGPVGAVKKSVSLIFHMKLLFPSWMRNSYQVYAGFVVTKGWLEH